jgi:hypothetical protein
VRRAVFPAIVNNNESTEDVTGWQGMRSDPSNPRQGRDRGAFRQFQFPE